MKMHSVGKMCTLDMSPAQRNRLRRKVATYRRGFTVASLNCLPPGKWDTCAENSGGSSPSTCCSTGTATPDPCQIPPFALDPSALISAIAAWRNELHDTSVGNAVAASVPIPDNDADELATTLEEQTGISNAKQTETAELAEMNRTRAKEMIEITARRENEKADACDRLTIDSFLQLTAAAKRRVPHVPCVVRDAFMMVTTPPLAICDGISIPSATQANPIETPVPETETESGSEPEVSNTSKVAAGSFASFDSYVYKLRSGDGKGLSDKSCQALVRINTKLATRRSRLKQCDVTELYDLELMIEHPLADHSEQERACVMRLPDVERDERIESARRIHVNFRDAFLRYLEFGEQSFQEDAERDFQYVKRGGHMLSSSF